MNHNPPEIENALTILEPGTALVLLNYYERMARDRLLQPFELARRDMCERILNGVSRKRMEQIAWPMDCADAPDAPGYGWCEACRKFHPGAAGCKGRSDGNR